MSLQEDELSSRRGKDGDEAKKSEEVDYFLKYEARI